MTPGRTPDVVSKIPKESEARTKMARGEVILGLHDLPGAPAALPWAASYARRSRLRLSARSMCHHSRRAAGRLESGERFSGTSVRAGAEPHGKSGQDDVRLINPDPERRCTSSVGRLGAGSSTWRVMRRCPKAQPANS
jgi:hypothetical protein